MFGVIGSVVGKLFGSQKAVDNLLDKDNGLLAKAGSWVGGLNYTEEEKAEADAETRKWGLKQLAALEPFKVVQRILAFGVTGLWGFVGCNVVAAIWVEAVYPYIEVKEAMMAFAMSDYVFWPVLAVLGLYFTGGIIPSKK